MLGMPIILDLCSGTELGVVVNPHQTGFQWNQVVTNLSDIITFQAVANQVGDDSKNPSWYTERIITADGSFRLESQIDPCSLQRVVKAVLFWGLRGLSYAFSSVAERTLPK